MTSDERLADAAGYKVYTRGRYYGRSKVVESPGDLGAVLVGLLEEALEESRNLAGGA